MELAYWRLPGGQQLAIEAPAPVLDVLGQSVVLQTSPATVPTVSLCWSEQAHAEARATYWQAGFGADDIVWRAHADGWLWLGDGILLQYHTGAATFYIGPNRVDDALRYSYPLLNLIIYLLRQAGYVPLHAAAIGADGQFALLPGRQNTGKSTTAATWLLHGGTLLSDDFCFVSLAQPTQAFGLYPSIRLRPGAVSLLQNLLPVDQLRHRDGQKHFLSIQQSAPGQFAPEGSLRAVFCLRVGHPQPTHRRATAAEGFTYLASSVAFARQYGADVSETLRAMRTLVTTLPVWDVALSADPAENYHYLRALLLNA